MSCLSCPCHFKWPMDTLGIKRDPINCEKAWLDFAVRLLSRETVGKGRGQETVWGAKCKPSWWDKMVGHPWKNPTANPKDTKEVLLDKYVALESHLRDENRFPRELEEESRLWKEGKYSELFLMTSLTSLLGKVTTVHSAIEDACVKVNDLKATVHQSVLTNIQNCLISSLKRTEQLNHVKSNTDNRESNVKTRPKKRILDSSGLHKENVECPSTKKKKVQHHQAQNVQIDSSCNQDLADCFANPDMQTTDILAFAQKLIAKRKSKPPKDSVNRISRNISTSRPQREILPKVVAQAVSQPSVTSLTMQLSTTLENSQKRLESDNTAPNSSQQSMSQTTPLNNVVSSSLAPVCAVTISPEQLELLLSQNTLPQFSRADHTLNLKENLQTSYPAVEPTQNIAPCQTTFCYDDLELDKELTSRNEAVNFRVDPVLVRSEASSNIPASTEDNICLNYVSQSEINTGSECFTSSTTSSSCPSEDLDLSFLNTVDIEKLCNELFKESQSSNDADSENCLKNTVSENDVENVFSSNFYCRVEENPKQLENLLELEATVESSLPAFVTDLTGHADDNSKVDFRALSSSSPDIGYCSDGSPSGSTGDNPMQQVRDLDPSYLLDTFLSYAEDPFSSDLH